MSNGEERLVSFYLEHYKQMNDAVRYTERNTQAVAGFYVTLTAGIMAFIVSAGVADWRKSVLGLFLLLLGIVASVYVCRARYWHCEHTEVAKAIHRMFVDNKLSLLEAANEVIQDNREIESGSRRRRLTVAIVNGVFFNKFWERACLKWLRGEFTENRGWSFFNPDGAEFWLYLFVLLLTGANGAIAILCWHQLDALYWLLVVPAVLLFKAVIFVGVWWYRGYLERKQDSFPSKSPFIMKRENEGGQSNEKS